MYEADLVCAGVPWRSLPEFHYRNYWVDERAGKILCLVGAPTAESAADVHRAHRLVADEIFEVSEG